jgi:dienelactone hydrolase
MDRVLACPLASPVSDRDVASEAAVPGLRLELHIADPDTYQSAAEVSAWHQGMTAAGVAVRVFRYPGAGHLFTDSGTPDHDGRAADLAWQRGISFLSSL